MQESDRRAILGSRRMIRHVQPTQRKEDPEWDLISNNVPNGVHSGKKMLAPPAPAVADVDEKENQKTGRKMVAPPSPKREFLKDDFAPVVSTPNMESSRMKCGKRFQDTQVYSIISGKENGVQPAESRSQRGQVVSKSAGAGNIITGEGMPVAPVRARQQYPQSGQASSVPWATNY